MKIPELFGRYPFAVAVPVIIMTCLCFAGAVSAASGGGHGEPASQGWVATDWYRVMNFTVLVVGLFFLLKKPVSQMLNSRIEGIREQLSELETKKKEAEKKLAEYDERLSALEREAQGIIDEYTRQGNEARTRILAEAEKAAVKIEEQARRNIEHEFNQTKLKLKSEVMEMALIKAEEIIKGKITAKDQEKLVEEYLEKVVA